MQNDPILKELQDQLRKIDTETKEMVKKLKKKGVKMLGF